MGYQRRIKERFYPLSQKGYSLIEIMAGLALVGTGAFIIMNGLDYLDSRKSVINKSASQEAIISGLMESVRTNIAMEKIDYQPEVFLNASEIEEVKKNLNLCWFGNGVIPLEEFPTCEGRLGYIVYPLKIGNLEYRGMYKVTIRVMHEKLMPGSYKQYDFIVKD
jgi:prepilin-type N-terminal cleavage/methylation domain-containing protein